MIRVCCLCVMVTVRRRIAVYGIIDSLLLHHRVINAYRTLLSPHSLDIACSLRKQFSGNEISKKEPGLCQSHLAAVDSDPPFFQQPGKDGIEMLKP